MIDKSNLVVAERAAFQEAGETPAVLITAEAAAVHNADGAAVQDAKSPR